MNIITRHTDTITQIKVPLPFPLRWVNSYLIRGSNGYTLIDPGLHTQESEACWTDAMREMKITFKDIEQVVLTHHHPDHYGMSGWFQVQSNVPVYLSEPSNQLAIRLWGEGQTLTQELYSFFLRHGMDPSLAAEMIPHMNSFIPLVSPQPQITLINEKKLIRLGETHYNSIMTSGHAAGHL
ncbi:MAG TPA: MBL fold metallo-hydrolase, partial [Bacilli bacterium]